VELGGGATASRIAAARHRIVRLVAALLVFVMRERGRGSSGRYRAVADRATQLREGGRSRLHETAAGGLNGHQA
jgi:hypothetical protein